MKLLVCGSRTYNDVLKLHEVLNRFAEDYGCDLLINGGAWGADYLAKNWAECNGIAVQIFPAQWKMYGRSAGHIRNKEMLDKGKPDKLIAFPAKMPMSAGTANMVQQALAYKIPTHIVSP